MNTTGRTCTLYFRGDTACLANLFDVTRVTIKRWIKAGLFDPSDIKDIYRYYYTREQNKCEANISSPEETRGVT